MKQTQEAIQGLIAEHGEEAVIKAVQVLTAKAARAIPAEHIPMLDASKLRDTIDQLDAGISDILTAGKANEEAYKDRADLVKKKARLETAIKLSEAEAIMQIQGSGKDAFVMIGGTKTALTNDTARDAYRRMSSKKEREELAQVEADLVAIDVDIAKAKERYNATQEANQGIRAKANLQAALLNFLR